MNTPFWQEKCKVPLIGERQLDNTKFVFLRDAENMCIVHKLETEKSGITGDCIPVKEFRLKGLTLEISEFLIGLL